jgi:hypothetical protein
LQIRNSIRGRDLANLLTGRGCAAQPRCEVDGEGDEALLRIAARDILEVGQQTAIFVDDDDAGVTAVGGWAGEISEDGAAGTLEGNVLAHDGWVVLGDGAGRTSGGGRRCGGCGRGFRGGGRGCGAGLVVVAAAAAEGEEGCGGEGDAAGGVEAAADHVSPAHLTGKVVFGELFEQVLLMMVKLGHEIVFLLTSIYAGHRSEGSI